MGTPRRVAFFSFGDYILSTIRLTRFCTADRDGKPISCAMNPLLAPRMYLRSSTSLSRWEILGESLINDFTSRILL